MAEFLNKKKLLEWVPKLIETAGKELVIISPYIQISEKIFKLLKELNIDEEIIYQKVSETFAMTEETLKSVIK